MNVGKIEVHTVGGDQWWSVVRASGSELESLERGGSRSGGMWLWDGRVFGTKDDSRKIGCGEYSEMDSKSCEFLGEALGNLNTCHHPDAGQILTITDAPRAPTCRSLWKESQRSKDTQINYQYLKTHYDACGQRNVRWISSNRCESSKLIVGCATSCRCHIRWLNLKKLCHAFSSNPGVIMTGIGFYGLTVIVDLLSLSLTENLRMCADISGIENLN